MVVSQTRNCSEEGEDIPGSPFSHSTDEVLQHSAYEVSVNSGGRRPYTAKYGIPSDGSKGDLGSFAKRCLLQADAEMQGTPSIGRPEVVLWPYRQEFHARQ